MGWYSYDWRPYVSVAERRRQAAKKVAKLRKSGHEVSPVEIDGRKIAATFWGNAWCKNLEAYSDYSNRLPRGRTYVRNGSVIDLQIESGRVRSLVSGSEIYEVGIKIKPLAKPRWTDIKGQCAGQIDSLVELLRGSISKGVMEIVTRKGDGLFPSPREISLSCSCPDWATMCKHVAATLYGVGARLDHAPEMLFTLRGVDPTEMVEAAVDQPTTMGKPRKGKVLAADELSSVFGVDIDMTGVSEEQTPQPIRRTRRAAQTRRKAASRTRKKTTGKPTKKKPAAKKAAAKKATKKKAATKKTSRKKATAKKPAQKAASKKTPSRKKPAVKKAATKKTATKKTGAKSTAKKPARKKTEKKTTTRKPALKKASKRDKE